MLHRLYFYKLDYRQYYPDIWILKKLYFKLRCINASKTAMVFKDRLVKIYIDYIYIPQLKIYIKYGLTRTYLICFLILAVVGF